MMFLAETDSSNALVIGGVALALATLASLAVSVVTLIRVLGGRDAERQIEPTALHAITSELKAQTVTLNKLDREVGEIRTNVGAVSKTVDSLSTDMATMELNVFKRVNAISTESTKTATRVDGLEKRESKENKS